MQIREKPRNLQAKLGGVLPLKAVYLSGGIFFTVGEKNSPETNSGTAIDNSNKEESPHSKRRRKEY